MKLLNIFLTVFTLAYSLSANAAFTQYFFEDRYENEVELLLIGGVSNPSIVGFVQDCALNNCDDLETIKNNVHDFVASVQRNEIYTYKNTTMMYSMLTWLNSIIPTKDSSTLSIQRTEAITHYLMSADSKKPPIMMVRKEAGSPVDVCAIDSTGCKVIDDIIFTKAPNGGVSVGMTANPYKTENTLSYKNLLETFMLSIHNKWRCASTGTNSDSDIKWSMACDY